MRQWIALFENNLFYYPDEDEHAIGYWFNPRSGKHFIISWALADNTNHFSDHADIVMDHPEWFGLDDDEGVCEDTDTARYAAILKGWSRIGYNLNSGMWLSAKSGPLAHRSILWFVEQQHRFPPSIDLSIVTNVAETSYRIGTPEDVSEYLANGKLNPAWKTHVHTW